MKIVLYLACTLAGIILVQACCHPNNEMSVSVTNESSQSFYLEQWRKGDTSLSRGYHTVNFVTYRQVISILENGWGWWHVVLWEYHSTTRLISCWLGIWFIENKVRSKWLWKLEVFRNYWWQMRNYKRTLVFDDRRFRFWNGRIRPVLCST